MPPKNFCEAQARAWRKEGGWGEEFRHARAFRRARANSQQYLTLRQCVTYVLIQYRPLQRLENCVMVPPEEDDVRFLKIAHSQSLNWRCQMLDIRFILDNVDFVRQNTLDRNANADVDKTVALYRLLKQKRQKP